MTSFLSRIPQRAFRLKPTGLRLDGWWRFGAAGLLGILLVGFGIWVGSAFHPLEQLDWKAAKLGEVAPAVERTAPSPPARVPGGPALVRLSLDQQKAIDLRTAPVTAGTASEELTAPGRIAPDETRLAYITPLAPGIVRSVTGYIGQPVRAGDLLATIDSPEVGQARLGLYTQLQGLEVAQAQADWQETTYHNTLELLNQIRSGATPAQIHRAFEGRPVGENREKLLTALAEYRLADATIERNRELHSEGLITPKQFQQVRAEFERAQAAYQSLMDEMEFQTRLAHTRSQQAVRQAETAVRVAREQLRILGVKPDGTEPLVAGGKVVGVQPDGTLPANPSGGPTEPQPEQILPQESNQQPLSVDPVGAHVREGQVAISEEKDKPVSTYSIWAPFDGTIIDRELIVPGVHVDTTRRIFTLADLSTVWLEVHVHESDFDMLARSNNAHVHFTSPAYPGRSFDGDVIYTGDVVDEKTRTILLLARARNPDRLLKPGMFVDVEVRTQGTREVVLIPNTAVLTHEDQSYVYVRTEPEQFERREVVTGQTEADGNVPILKGQLRPGEEVVIGGAFKIKSRGMHLASLE